MLGAHVPVISTDTNITGAQAISMLRDVAFDLFPGLRTKT
jgi:hypothetical protein